MTKPLLLDLFCGVGGASVGYARAGFDVVGVDIKPQPNYPFEFHQADALEFLADTDLKFDAIHTSPPCQGYSSLTSGTNFKTHGEKYVKLIPQTRELLAQYDVPSVIENVTHAPVRKDINLCGEMFGLKVIRHRLFEVNNFSIPQPKHLKHRGRVKGWRHGKAYEGYYYAVYGNGGQKGTPAEWQDAMGIHWTSRKVEIAEAIPPAYTEYIGKYMMEKITNG